MHDAKPFVAAACLTLAPAAACVHPASPPREESADGRSPAAARVAGVRPGVVDGATGRKLVEAGVQVVDVRTSHEFAAAHVPGAKNIPVDQIAARADELGSSSTPVLLYCRSGHRAAIAREMLQRQGFTAVYDMRTLTAWERSAQ
jgi:phage shock protein E